MKLPKFVVCFILFFTVLNVQAQEKPITRDSFANINLSYPGLQTVNAYYQAGDYESAASALLSYYRARRTVTLPDYNLGEEAKYRGKSIGADNQLMADNALIHLFKPHRGYPYFSYGSDIDWKYWPVKDNELRWQLHRVGWWPVMGLAYRSSVDERYAREWVFQFRDWARKNPLGLSADNDAYAWRSLEVSERLQLFPNTFNLFVSSPNFTPAFLMEFLNSVQFQTNYVRTHYTMIGNHLLFQSARVLRIGSFFPELASAPEWRSNGISILSAEMQKQVFADGVHFELSPNYHVAAIDIFVEGFKAARISGMEKEFPPSYISSLEKMIEATAKISFPDYNPPMFGDAWLIDKASRIKQFADWATLYPNNALIKYFALSGNAPEPTFTSTALSNAGFYTFRNGWKPDSTILILKASRPGTFHAQPDNGTFELWANGRNFMPDSGSFLYSGSPEINLLRDWYRQSRVHNTMTLDNQNMLTTNAVEQKWFTSSNLDILTYSNPSYTNLKHQRSVLFVNKKYFLVLDAALGTASGAVDVHFNLREDSAPSVDTWNRRIFTNYSDGNNLLIQMLNPENKTSLVTEQGKVSYSYNKETSRPEYAFHRSKSLQKPEFYLSLLMPYKGAVPPQVKMTKNPAHDFFKNYVDITITIDGVTDVVRTKVID